MITRDNRLISFICDGDSCSRILDTMQEDFKEALYDLKSENWKIVKESDGEWMHLCPECK